MGLDISHIHLTLQPNKNGDFFDIKNWDLDCNVPLKNYSKYITSIDDLNYNKIIAVVKNEEDYEKLNKQKWISSANYLKVFIGHFNEKMEEQLSKFIINQKLDNYETLRLGCESEGIKFHTISFGEPIKVQGVYYIDYIGYQRKGMNSFFYDTFQKHLLWGKKEDFELAYTCIVENGLFNLGDDSVAEIKANFKANFIDKFEFGKSLLFVSF